MNILLIGCGKMGSAMLSAWLGGDIVTRAVIVDRHPNDTTRRFAAHESRIEVYADVSNLPADIQADIVVLATKPQQMASVLAELAPRLQTEWPVITMAAGRRAEFYAQYLPSNPIIRVMPNTPALVGKGMTVAVAAHALPPILKEQVEKLLAATGDFFWLDNEDQLDAAAAISASGPAYFFYLAEQLAKTGEKHGLTEEQAQRLARQTLVGAGAVADDQTQYSLTQLRKDVTSPGGVTAAAIAAFEDHNALPYLVLTAITANIKRSQELAKS